MIRRSDEQRRAIFAKGGRLRRAARTGARHLRTLAGDPEVRQAAASLAVLGGAALALRATPHVNKLAIRKWRRLAPPRSAGRRMLMQWVLGTQRTRRFQRLLEGPGLRSSDKWRRLAARAQRSGKSLKELEQHLETQKGWKMVGGKVVLP